MTDFKGSGDNKSCSNLRSLSPYSTNLVFGSGLAKAVQARRKESNQSQNCARRKS